MPQTSASRTIDAPVEEVWRVLVDFGSTSVYNPSVPKSFSVGELASGLGAKRRCEFDDAGKKYIEERIVAFDDANRSYTVEIVDGPAKPPVDHVHVDISAVPDGPDRTVVTMSADLSGDGLKGKVMAAVGAPMLKRVSRQVLAGLDHHITTGEPVKDLTQLKSAGVKV